MSQKRETKNIYSEIIMLIYKKSIYRKIFLKKLLSADNLQTVILTHFMFQKNKHPMRVSATAIKNQGTKYIQVPFCK